MISLASNSSAESAVLQLGLPLDMILSKGNIGKLPLRGCLGMLDSFDSFNVYERFLAMGTGSDGLSSTIPTYVSLYSSFGVEGKDLFFLSCGFFVSLELKLSKISS